MACNQKCFTVTWRIENYHFSYSTIGSPSFFIDSQKKMSWFLQIIPKTVLKKSHIAFHAKNNTCEALGVTILASFYSDDESTMLYEGLFGTKPDRFLSSACYVPYSNVYFRKSDEFLPPKTLIIRCRMYKTEGSFSEAGQCDIRTRNHVQKDAFVVFQENFSDVLPNKTYSLPTMSTSPAANLFQLGLRIGGNSLRKKTICIEIRPWRRYYFKYCKCTLFIFDTVGLEIECSRKEFSALGSEEWKCSLCFTKDYLMSRKDKFLENNTLNLKFEFEFSTGVEYQAIEDSEYVNRVLANRNHSKSRSAFEDFTRLYEEGIFSDVKLKAETVSFKAHKNILSARSSVFRRMLTTDMKEKYIDCVIIEDLDADTVHRMLLYLYSDRLEDLDWEKAKNLYFAAAKYNIVNLQNKCSNFLKSELEPNKCCEILILADMHQDDDLKKSVQEYIADDREDIFRSDQWANLEKTNPMISIETFFAVVDPEAHSTLIGISRI